MTADTFWTIPADPMTTGSGVHHNLTVLLPPFTTIREQLPVNDPDRAAEFALSLDKIDTVLEHLGPRPAADIQPLMTRADLDIVQVGTWGNVLAISDPAFVDNGDSMPLLGEATRLRDRFPDARIVGRVSVHCGAEHTEDLVWLPDGTMFHACGWPGDEPFVVTGDPHAVASALGITAETFEDLEVYVDLDDEPGENDWAAFAGLALGEADPWPSPRVNTSALRVQHSEYAVSHMESLYFITG
ncbi:DUF6333 family protein [Streptomyces sp. NBC_01142]|uniref:DUF6333 family protein n=1 Tax=Streptomyces sp. NBC_01142 TaxID=2975865 RepID=UPI0022503983|nr:DUF6333 family protein [Streptomyces sp. NBC_01142]MCX4825799.1 DUF6333 family protein [Streptomyces sp. NBC_01142]